MIQAVPSPDVVDTQVALLVGGFGGIIVSRVMEFLKTMWPETLSGQRARVTVLIVAGIATVFSVWATDPDMKNPTTYVITVLVWMSFSLNAFGQYAKTIQEQSKSIVRAAILSGRKQTTDELPQRPPVQPTVNLKADSSTATEALDRIRTHIQSDPNK